MASITIRDLNGVLNRQLRSQAAVHGRSMEEEARDILRAGLSEGATPKDGLAASIRARFGALGGVELPDVVREPMREPPTFE